MIVLAGADDVSPEPRQLLPIGWQEVPDLPPPPPRWSLTHCFRYKEDRPHPGPCFARWETEMGQALAHIWSPGLREEGTKPETRFPGKSLWLKGFLRQS